MKQILAIIFLTSIIFGCNTPTKTGNSFNADVIIYGGTSSVIKVAFENVALVRIE